MPSLVAAPPHRRSLDVHVLGDDAGPLTPSDLARLFPDVSPLSPRFDRLARARRVEVRAGGAIVGVAVYQRAGAEVRVPAVGLAPADGVERSEVLLALLDALEAMCLAGGGRRLLVIPPPRSERWFRRRGYEVIHEGCAGAWVEKAWA